MKKNLLFILAISTLLFSCKRTKKDMIMRSWQAVALDNPQLNDMISQQQTFIDTVGKNTSADDNEKLYGVRNIDSLKQVLQGQLDSFKVMQDNSLKNTLFTFKKGGQAILKFNTYTDTSKWYFNDDGDLMLDEIKEKGYGDRLKMNVTELNDTILQLKFIKDKNVSTVTFKPAQK